MDFRNTHARPPHWRRRLLLGGLLALAHLALLLGLAPTHRPAQHAPAGIARSELRLLQPRSVAKATAASPPPRAQAPALMPPQIPLLPAPAIEMLVAAPSTATETGTSAPSSSPMNGSIAGGGDSARAPLVIALPKAGKPGEFRPDYNPAAHDPRGNSIKLRFEEKMAIAAGTAECFLEEREPDGSIWRGPGRLVTRTGSGGGGGLVKLCVRS